MDQNQKAIVVLSLMLFVVFAGMVGAGTYLLCRTPADAEASETNVKIGKGEDGWNAELTTSIPGIVLIVLGGAGLLMMLFKVPVEKIGDGPRFKINGGRHMMSFVSSPLFQFQPAYDGGGESLRVPLPVWWLIKGQGGFFRKRNIRIK